MIIPEIVNGLGSGAEESYIKFSEKNIGVSLPKLYLDCIRQADQGTFKNPAFSYIDPYSTIKRKTIRGGLVSFDPTDRYNILRQYFLMPSFFPKNLLPIGIVGNGDYVCFDYSVSGFDDKDPPVVLWIHDNPEGKEIADIAINFEEFLIPS